MKMRNLLGSLAVIGTLVAAAPLQAAVLTLDFQGFKNGSRSGQLEVNSVDIGTIKAGMFDFSVTNIDGDPEVNIFERILAFCLEADVDLSDPALYDLLSTSDYFNDASKLGKIEQLFSDRFGETGNAEADAAFQLALWEIVYDNGGSLADGNFVADGYGTSLALAQSWIDNLGTGDSYSGLWALKSDGTLNQESVASQDLITWVPEPGVLALLGAGLIGFGAMRRRRQA